MEYTGYECTFYVGRRWWFFRDAFRPPDKLYDLQIDSSGSPHLGVCEKQSLLFFVYYDVDYLTSEANEI